MDTENREEYDPYKFRDVKHPTSYFDTWIHMLKASLGTGMLAMPIAFKNSGYALGIVGMIFVGFLCSHCIRILVITSYKMCVFKRVPSLSYADTVAAVFEESGEITRKFAVCARLSTNIFLILYQIGCSSIYVVFIATNIKTIVNVYVDDDFSERTVILISILPLLLISYLKNLKHLVPFSSIATTLTLVSLICTMHYLFDSSLSFDDRQPIASIKNIPMYFGTVFFAMEAIGMILPLQNEMKDPSQFGTTFGVLNVSMSLITFIYGFVGFMGYLRYGNNVKGSITLDLPEHEPLVQIIKICLSLSIYINYALSNYVAFKTIWDELKPLIKNDKYNAYFKNLLRTITVILTIVIAIVIPNLEHLISLIGAFCLSFVGIALPAIIYYFAFIEDCKKDGLWICIPFCLTNLLIVLIAVFAFISGVSINISNMISIPDTQNK